jgi:uncharacterized membrane protein YfhO
VVFSQGGLIAVRVPAGAQRLRLVYRSDFFRIGAAISLLTCLIAPGAVEMRAALENRSSP